MSVLQAYSSALLSEGIIFILNLSLLFLRESFLQSWERNLWWSFQYNHCKLGKKAEKADYGVLLAKQFSPATKN